MNPPSIAAIIPVYNRATTVLTALDSVADQSLPPQRLIVVDDGSRDGSAESIERWVASRRPRFETQIIRQANQGAAAARNRGFAAASDCDWLAILDSDDLWPSDHLERASAALAGQPEAIVAVADRLFFEAATGEQRLFDMSPLAVNPALWMLRWGGGLCSCSVLRAELVRELGGFPEHLMTGEDAGLFLRMSLRRPWLHLPGTPVWHVRHKPTAGEEEALSRKFSDNQRRWALVFDAFFRGLSRDERRQIGHRTQVRKLMSERWRRAGLELEGHGKMLAAAACYTRSIRWRPSKWERWQPLVHMPWKVVAGTARRAA